jgi:hypothetical protein
VATKNAPIRPGSDDWQNLGVISAYADRLVDDAEGKTLDTNLGKLKAKMPEGKSEFSIRVDTALSLHRSQRVIEILPNANDLGSTRDERLSKLRSSCTSLPAFNWLTNQNGFSAAIDTMKRLGAQYKIPAYLDDTTDFKLMQVLVRPASLHQDSVKFGYVLNYPSRNELQDLSKRAGVILDALNQKQFSPKIEVSAFLFNALAAFKTEIDAKSPGWTKPHQDAALKEAEFQYQVIENCLVMFKECSPTVVQHISGVFGISVDDAKVRARINAQKAKQAKNPQNGYFFTWVKSR